MRLSLNLTQDFMIESGNLTIQNDPDSKLKIEEDGLYAESIPGKDGTGGSGYDDYYDDEGLRLGYETPFITSTKSPRVITCVGYVHRMYDAGDDNGETLLNFRPSVDYVLAGDLYRVNQDNGKYRHFLVIAVEPVEDGTTKITESVELGVW